MELLYIEIKKSTNKISCTCPYKYRGKYLEKSNGLDVIEDDTYKGFIIDVNFYFKKYKIKKMKSIPLVVHQYIITKSRNEKIKQIKSKINGSSI